jgi:hypothetical protein
MTTTVKPGPKDLLANLTADTYADAYRQGKTLSGWLDEQMPEADYNDGLDGFSRLLKVAGVKLNSDHARGIYADEFRVLEQTPGHRALAPEIIARLWRRAAFGVQPRASKYVTDEDLLNTWARPYSDNGSPRGPRLEPAIPLSELVALTTPIDSDAYRTFYLTTDAAATRMVRVGERGELPKATLTSAEHTVRLYKFGRALDISYEQLRRMRFDKLAFHIGQMAIQTESDKVQAVINVIVNGDGNTDTAAYEWDLNGDFGGVLNTLDRRSWFRYKLKFQNPYQLTTVIADEDVVLDLFELNAGTANQPVGFFPVGTGDFTLINKSLADGVRVAVHSDAPARTIVGFDKRLCVERVYEVGSNISEIQRWVTSQTQVLTFSEVEGYAILDKDSAQLLNIND